MKCSCGSVLSSEPDQHLHPHLLDLFYTRHDGDGHTVIETQCLPLYPEPLLGGP